LNLQLYLFNLETIVPFQVSTSTMLKSPNLTYLLLMDLFTPSTMF